MTKEATQSPMNATRYYYLEADGQTVRGPYASAELRAEWTRRSLPPTTLCAREGEEQWLPLDQMVDELYTTNRPVLATTPVSPVSQPAQAAGGDWKVPLIVITAFILVAAAIGGVANVTGQAQARQQAQQEEQAKVAEDAALYQAAQRAVEGELRAPGSARFCPWQEVKGRAFTSGGSAMLDGWVDSQNGFGALLRSDWHVFMEKQDGSWRATRVTVEPRK